MVLIISYIYISYIYIISLYYNNLKTSKYFITFIYLLGIFIYFMLSILCIYYVRLKFCDYISILLIITKSIFFS